MEDKILVVDDEDTLRLTMQARLKDAGFHVDTATDGYEALIKLEQDRFDVMLLDINMPGMNGLQVLEFLATTYPDVETIVLTGFSDMSTAIECLKKGAKDYIVKPFDYADLLARIRALIRARRSEESMQEYKRRWRSALVYDVFGSLYTVQCILEFLQHGFTTRHTKESAELLSYARLLNERMFDQIKNSVSLADLAETIVPLERTSINLATLLHVSCDRFERWANEKSVTIIRAFDKDLPSVDCDLKRIEQVINTLFDSAIKSANSGGSILVEATALTHDDSDRARVACTITYTGDVLLPEELPIILAEGKDQWKSVPEGLSFWGLSLAISRRILEDHGGGLTIEAVVGQKTMMTIFLPVGVSVPQERAGDKPYHVAM